MRSPFLLLASTLLACAGPRPSAAPTPAATTEPFVCRYSLNPMYLPPATLRLTRDGRPFAKMKTSGKAGVELTLPYGPAAQGARLTFTSGWVTMRVLAEPDEGVRLALQAPLALSPVLSLGRGAHVRWTGNDGERLVVTAERPEALQRREPFTTTVACEDTSIAHLGLTWPKDAFDAEDAGTKTYLELPAGVAAPVSLVPGGPPVETVRFEKYERRLRVLGEEGGAVRIRTWVGEGRLDGYVPRSVLVAPKEEGGLANVFGMGGLGLSGREGGGQKQHARCAAEVPLSLRLDGQVLPLGTLRKNAAWREVARGGGLVEIALPELGWLTLEPGAAFVVTEADAAACAVAPAGG